jgi:hypothetical protein
MNLRTAVATVLDSAYDIKGIEVETRLPDGTETRGKLSYDAAQEVVKTMACRLIRAEESARGEKLSLKNRRTRNALMNEFDLEIH